MNINNIIGQHTCSDCGQKMSIHEAHEHTLFCMNKGGSALKKRIEILAEKAAKNITFYDGFWKKGYNTGFKEADAIGFALWLNKAEWVQMNPDIDKWYHYSPDNKSSYTTQELYVKYLNTK